MPKKPKPLLVTPGVQRELDAGVLLVTGFEPFGREEINSSELVARALHGQSIGGLTVVSVVLPCVFATAPGAMQQAIEQWQPRLVLALGQAAGRNELSLERVAINVIDATIEDNAGQQPIDVPVVVDGPPAHFTTLPVKAMVNAIRKSGLHAGLSNSAGTFVCNQVFYCLQHQLADAQLPVPSGFMHVPLLPEQTLERAADGDSTRQQPSLALHDMVRGVREALTAACVSLSRSSAKPT